MPLAAGWPHLMTWRLLATLIEFPDMSQTTLYSRRGFHPLFRVLPPAGTNGYLSTWGEYLSGTMPIAVDSGRAVVNA